MNDDRPKQDYYKLLNVGPSSTAEDIRKAINRKVRRLQARTISLDRSIRKKANVEMKILLEARRVLLNPEKRAEYDELVTKYGLPELEKSEESVSGLPLPKQSLSYSIALLLDASGSMEGEKLEDAKEAVTSFVDTVDLTQNEVALITFGVDVTCPDGLTQDSSTLRAATRGLEADGGTPMMQAIRMANEDVLPKGAAKPIMVIATDGVPTDSSEENILAYAHPVKQAGTWIITIGIGDNVNEEFLKKLASSPEDYHFAKASFQLKDIYKGVVSGLVIRK